MVTTILTLLGAIATIFATWYSGKLLNFLIGKWNEFSSERRIKESEDEIAKYYKDQADRNKKIKDIMAGKNIENNNTKQ